MPFSSRMLIPADEAELEVLEIPLEFSLSESGTTATLTVDSDNNVGVMGLTRFKSNNIIYQLSKFSINVNKSNMTISGQPTLIFKKNGNQINVIDNLEAISFYNKDASHSYSFYGLESFAQSGFVFNDSSFNSFLIESFNNLTNLNLVLKLGFTKKATKVSHIKTSSTNILNILLKYNGTSNSTIDIPFGEKYVVNATVSQGHSLQSLLIDKTGKSTSITNNQELTSDGDALIRGTTQVINKTITITQTANQEITVTCNGVAHTSTFTAPYGSTYTATIKSTNAAYNPGKLNITSGTLTENIAISATAAALKTYTVTITQPTGGSITINCNGTNHTSNFVARHGDKLTVNVTANTGYNITSIKSNGTTISNGGTVTVTGAVAITATLALKTYTVTITQPTGGTINAVCNGTTYTKTFTATHGSTVRINVTANTGYNITSIKSNGTTISNGGTVTVTGAVAITATLAIIQHTVTVTQPEHGRITIDGVYGTSFKVNHGKQITIEATADEGYVVTDIIVS